MKITSSKPKGERIFKSYKRPYWIEPVGSNWWFSLEKGEWIKDFNGEGGMTSTYYALSSDGFNEAYSLKAVKRLIHKWNVPKGTVFIASLPWVGYQFEITK